MSALTKWVRGESRKGLVTNLLPELDSTGNFTGFYQQLSGLGPEEWDATFEENVRNAYHSNGVVWACVHARMMPFSEVRFALQELADGNPGKLRGDASLRLLEDPWPNGKTGDLLARMELDVSMSGNFFATTAGDGTRLRRLRPDWVKILTGIRGVSDGSPYDIESEVLGYMYTPPGQPMTWLSPARVAHYAPYPDPLAQWRGMSWITPLVREIRADHHATTHKLKWFENGAALNAVIRYDPSVKPEQLRDLIKLFKETHRGPDKAYEVLHIGGGSDVSVLGTELKTDFRAIQGAGETRIAAAAGVGAIIARFSEGLAGSSLNQGNYAAAKRQVADMTLRPLWRSAAGSLEKFTAPTDAERLWYDTRDVEFLKEDRKDAAEIRQTTATTMKTLIDAGYTPESVVLAIESDDFTRLEHSGLYSVQLQSPGSDTPRVEGS